MKKITFFTRFVRLSSLYFIFFIFYNSHLSGQPCFDNALNFNEETLNFNPSTKKVIRLKFHVLRNQDLSWGFSEALGNQVINATIAKLNLKANNNQLASHGPSPKPKVWDMNISFELEAVQYYQLDLCQLNASNFNPSSTAFNIFFEEKCDFDEPCNPCYGGVSSFLSIPFSVDIWRPYFRYNNGDYADFPATVCDVIIHEIGHNAGLDHATNYPAVEQDCADVYTGAPVCESNNFMDGCAGLKGCFTPCQLSTFHNYINTSLQAMSYPNNTWTMPQPTILTLEDGGQDGMLYVGFNEDDYNYQQIEYYWQVNNGGYSSSPIVGFDLLEHDGKTINLCLIIRDKVTKCVKKVCKDFIINVPTCPSPITEIAADIIVENNSNGSPLNLSFSGGPLPDVFWTFSANPPSITIDDPCAQEPNLIYPAGQFDFWGGTLNACAKRYKLRSNGYCKQVKCQTIVINPKYPDCNPTQTIGFDHLFKIDPATSQPKLYLKAHPFSGLKKTFWQIKINSTNETFILEGKNVEIPYLPNYEGGMQVWLHVIDYQNNCKVSSVFNSFDTKCFTAFQNSVSITKSGYTINLFYNVSVANSNFNPSATQVYFNGNSISSQITWTTASTPNGLNVYGTYTVPSTYCGAAKINLFHEQYCIFGPETTLIFGTQPCKEYPQTPNAEQLVVSPNPSLNANSISIQFQANVSEMMNITISNSFGFQEQSYNYQATVGTNTYTLYANSLSQGLKIAKIYSSNNSLQGMFLIN